MPRHLPCRARMRASLHRDARRREAAREVWGRPAWPTAVRARLQAKVPRRRDTVTTVLERVRSRSDALAAQAAFNALPQRLADAQKRHTDGALFFAHRLGNLNGAARFEIMFADQR